MSRLALYLTLPGGGGRSAPPPPPPPAPPPPAPTMQQAEQTAFAQGSQSRTEAVRRTRMRQGMGGTVRNVGGAQGLDIRDTARALKALTGQ